MYSRKKHRTTFVDWLIFFIKCFVGFIGILAVMGLIIDSASRSIDNQYQYGEVSEAIDKHGKTLADVIKDSLE